MTSPTCPLCHGSGVIVVNLAHGDEPGVGSYSVDDCRPCPRCGCVDERDDNGADGAEVRSE